MMLIAASAIGHCLRQRLATIRPGPAKLPGGGSSLELDYNHQSITTHLFLWL